MYRLARIICIGGVGLLLAGCNATNPPPEGDLPPPVPPPVSGNPELPIPSNGELGSYHQPGETPGPPAGDRMDQR